MGGGASYQFRGQEVEVPFDTDDFPADKKNKVATLLDFEALGAEPNDLLTFFFWAEDLGPDGATRRVQGDLHFAEVRHFEEIFREVPNQGGSPPPGEGGEESQELLEAQKEVMNATWNLKRLAGAGENDIAEDAAIILEGQQGVISLADAAAAEITDAVMLGHLEEATEAMGSAVETLQPTADLSAALAHENQAYAALLRLREREFQITQASESQSASSSSSQRKKRQMTNMELKQEEKRYETQKFAEEQQQQQQENREDVQIRSRLKELARRQEAVTDKVQELEAMLEEAETEEEREELRRELERLEEEQRALVADLDELDERMQTEENSSRTAEAREQLEDAREQAQAAAESLENEQLDQAANAGARAGQEFEELAEEFRERTSNQFAEQVRDARQQARKLAEDEKAIAEQLAARDATSSESAEDEFADSLEAAGIVSALEAQGEELDKFLETLSELSETAEDTEPVLSRRLRETVRDAEAGSLAEDLDAAGQLVRYGRPADAAELERSAREGIDDLQESVESAAEGILGDETSALRMARSEVEELLNEVEESESARTQQAGGTPGTQPGESEEDGEGEPREDGQQLAQQGQQPGEGQTTGRRGRRRTTGRRAATGRSTATWPKPTARRRPTIWPRPTNGSRPATRPRRFFPFRTSWRIAALF